MRFIDRVALLLWRDVNGYEVGTGRVGDHNNVSLLTRFRQARSWFANGWAANWKWWVTTIIATSAVAAAIVPLYLNVAKPSEKMDARGGELLLKCVEERKCIIRIEPLGQRNNDVLPSAHGHRFDDGGAGDSDQRTKK
ncbi:hypothetical protein OTB17_04145 [Massilia sp. H27-R4]|nr:hypothetical protein [Massilia sp. H27-R4]